MSPRPKLAPWQLWVVDFGNPVGHEQGGTRPAIVVGSAVHCGFHIDMRCPELSGQGSNRILIGKGTGSSAKRQNFYS